jgi:Fe-Mn family superoxide dismutase
MITRRAALAHLGLATGALAFSHPTLLAQEKPATAAAEAEGVYKLPPLGYDYDALEPFIDAETMKLHHDKHHAAYVSKLNQAVAKLPGFERKPIEEVLANLDALPEEVRSDVRNQGGGHANHTLFWQMLKRNETARPTGALAKAIEKSFGSYDDFWGQFSGAAGRVFGSGWAWLAWRDDKLAVETTPNQDSPLMTGATPLLGIDVWEHAYYLRYQDRRAEYVDAFQQVIHWPWVAERFAQFARA